VLRKFAYFKSNISDSIKFHEDNLMKILFLLFALMIPAMAEDWTVCGKTYHNVTVSDSNDSTVSVMYDGGMGRLNLSDLPPDLQKRFNYDPVKAKTAAKAEADKTAEATQETLDAAQQEAKADAQANPPTSQPAQAAQPILTPEQRNAILAQIDALQQDISYMQQEEAKVVSQTLMTDQRKVTNGAYADKIVAEQAQVQQLKDELK
jgi:hypothetical protein